MLRLVNLSDSKILLEWRNSDEVRLGLFSQETIVLESHEAWIRKALESKLKHLFIYEENEPCGFVQLDETGTDTGIYEWGFYKAPSAKKGVGGRMLSELLKHVFITLNAKKVVGKVLKYNEASLRLHTKLGFEVEGIQKEQHPLSGTYHDIVLFGLRISEYNKIEGEAH